ncbi:adenosylhomocysteinase [Rathayibacter sp. SD072]|uniref:adenosylhomocysteinase n=1 Tax=Rathayibacter sp. SD072 TaxID=2781731 RepID=UPI001A95BE7F|nr:adenosylhomocysteinase [Rathayibacter sp. SD072]MBO0983281.1 adenosylhomocysteinase [Rathayibacter sp. SD072]
MSGRIRDASLWRQGQDKIDWASRFMPVTGSVVGQLRESGSIAGLRIGLVLVLEPKTATLALELAAAGAEVSVMCGASNTHDDTAAALEHAGVSVFARSDATAAEDHAFALDLLDHRLDILVDDGSSVTRLAHTERPAVFETLRGATEETTSGLRPLRVMEREGALRIPVLAVNDARCKTLFDNRHGTGQSTLLTMLDLLAAPLDRAHVVVAGFGHVGRGVAQHARALGARVTVSEVDPVRALEAVFAGYDVAPLEDAARTADLLVSATGIAHTIDVEHLLALPEGAAVAVSGGVAQEIAIDAAVAAGAVRESIGHALERFVLPTGRSIVVLDDGGCINCTAGEGNPIEIMDLSFGVQAAAIDVLAREAGTLAPAVHLLPPEVDDRVARAKLASLGVAIDSASRAQQDFLGSWTPTGRRAAPQRDGARS